MGEIIIAYLATPFGFYEHGRDLILPRLVSDIKGTGIDEVIEPFAESPYGTSAPIVIKNNREGREKSDLIVGILDGDGPNADEGVAIEVVEFCKLGKPAYALSTDYRRDKSEENRGINHELYYPTIENAEQLGVGGVFESWDELLTALFHYVTKEKGS